jgi:adenylate kinase
VGVVPLPEVEDLQLKMMRPQSVILLGAPAAGKGTHARGIASTFKIPHISTGNMLRQAVERRNQQLAKSEKNNPDKLVYKAVGERIGGKMESGQLVSDSVVNSMVKERIAAQDCERGFILDGYPRTISQAQFLDGILAEGGWTPIVLNIRAEPEILLKRASGRRICPVCGEIYNVYFRPPKVEGICDNDGSPLIHRADDNEETVRQRLLVYEEQTRPLLEYYQGRPCFHEVDGNRPPESISGELYRLLRKA